ncbi:putative membrane protein [Rhodopirellula maiorica SM1]|uniref:Putative membrane protein n=1 Tax=Rhodopirellula maiorica SM1 TaxID=1265738 RepID=M5RXF9_9BACT|nr:hypothetical protein [Rhodopirellula maiorica]EMI18629.1 putative membrane protein [Rhodopirellula maiorica SM1]
MTPIPPQLNDPPSAMPAHDLRSTQPTAEDIDQLRLLSIFHYVVGGIIALMSLIPIVHVVLGIAIVSGALDDANADGTPPPAVFGWLFIIFPSLMIGIGMTIACCVFVAGRKLGAYQAHLFCLVMAAVECMFMPFGTVLGVFTILVLMRPSVKALFGNSAAATTDGGGRS